MRQAVTVDPWDELVTPLANLLSFKGIATQAQHVNNTVVTVVGSINTIPIDCAGA